MADIHGIGAWVAIGLTGVTGIWGLLLAVLKHRPGRAFTSVALTAVGVMLAQGALGLILFAGGGEPGSGHLFYGMVIVASVAFGYIYRSQLTKRPALAWGLFLLFLMGLGFRAIDLVGTDFGG